MARLVKWLIQLRRRKSAIAEIPKEPADDTVTTISQDQDEIQKDTMFLKQDFGWSDPDPSHKKVYLTNPQECKVLTFMGLVSSFRGMGHSEWEGLISDWLLNAIDKANKAGHTEADITEVFDKDLYDSTGKTFTKEQIWKHLIRFFKIVDESEEYVQIEARVQPS